MTAPSTCAALPACETLALERQGPVLTLTLNRPEQRNAMNLAMVREMADVFSLIAPDPEIRAVVLRGTDGHFCAGGDVRDMAQARSATGMDGDDPFFQLNRAFGHLITQVDRAPQVVLAVLEGAVLGGGFGLACVSDVALCAPSARFGLPETGLGIPPAQIAPFVVKRIGLTQARRLALLGARFDGAEAVRLGIAHELVESADIPARLETLLGQIRRCAPGANRVTKDLLHRVGEQPLEQLLDHAALAFSRAIQGDEGQEGTLAFMQKRLPSWADDASAASD